MSDQTPLSTASADRSMIPRNQIEMIWLKATQNKLALRYIDEIKELCATFEGREDFAEIQFDAKSHIGSIYLLKKSYKKAFAIDLELLPLRSVTHPNYWGIIYSATFNSAKLGRTAEVRPYVDTYLLATYAKETLFDFDFHLLVLAWYVTHFPDGKDGSFDEFKPVLSAIVSALDIEVDSSLSFQDRVLFLEQQKVKGAKRFNELYEKKKAASAEEWETILNTYLVNEPILAYRKLALRRFKKDS